MDLMENPELRAKMGKAGREHVLENFHYRVVAQKFIKLISERLGVL
jgi:glycosyltransferase involved in cell wall biosynthesis